MNISDTAIIGFFVKSCIDIEKFKSDISVSQNTLYYLFNNLCRFVRTKSNPWQRKKSIETFKKAKKSITNTRRMFCPLMVFHPL